MCTAKIPPRPCLFLLAALFLLAGCSPQYSMRVISETDGHAYPNDQYTYYIASSMERSAVPRLRSCVSVKPVSDRVFFTSCLRS